MQVVTASDNSIGGEESTYSDAENRLGDLQALSKHAVVSSMTPATHCMMKAIDMIRDERRMDFNNAKSPNIDKAGT